MGCGHPRARGRATSAALGSGAFLHFVPKNGPTSESAIAQFQEALSSRMNAKQWHAGEYELPEEPPTPRDPVERCEAITAEDFLNRLSPRGEYFGGSYLGGAWLYRGQSDAAKPLIPAALRLARATCRRTAKNSAQRFPAAEFPMPRTAMERWVASQRSTVTRISI